MSNSRKNLRPQDLLVALKLSTLGSTKWNQQDLSNALGLSPSEVTISLERLRNLHLISDDKKKPLPGALVEFLVHGLKYVFPSKIGATTRGMPTAAAMGLLSKNIRLPQNNILVWPDPEGKVRGQSLEPLYPTVVQAAKKDAKLYELLALVDAIRIGTGRERESAKSLLSQILLGATV